MGLFNFKKERIALSDLSVLKTDIHSHFIPGIDDGSVSIENSLELLAAMESFGYQKVITTPHIMSDAYKNTPEIILGGLEKVREALATSGLKIKIDAAAEYYFDFELEKKIRDKNILTFGKNYMLFELAFVNAPENLYQVTFDMQTQGYKPVLAHVERYGFWVRDYAKYEELADRGILLQVNINSLTGHYSIETKKAAQWLIDKDMVSFLGSDCHHMGHIELMKKALKEKYLHKLLASKKLLNAIL
jgi:tyrosine-protein phosphatase YwqE